MTRTEKIALLSNIASTLDEEFLDDIIVAAQHASSGKTVYETLPEAMKQEIQDAKASLDRGEGIPSELVFSSIRKKISAAKA